MKKTLFAAGLLVLLALPACEAPRVVYRNTYHPGGMVETGGHVRFVVSQRQYGSDDVVFVVTCPVEARSVTASGCWWQNAGDARNSPQQASRVAAARATAGAEHQCAYDEITVQSNGTRRGVEGYWLVVCGTQRFYQWREEHGRFVDRTDVAPTE